MATTKTLMTAEQLAKMPDDGRKLELVKGELIDMPPAGYAHGRVASRIDRRIGAYAEQHGLGEVVTAEAGFRIARDPDTIRVPDVAFVAKGRIPQDDPSIVFPDQAPDLVVEVASPSNSATLMQAKVEEWLAAGVRLVWVVYPNTRSVVVYQPDMTARVLTHGDTLAGEPVLPGFSCKVSEIFS